MICKPCGRGGLGAGTIMVLARFGKVIEPTCWPCTYWTRTGKVYDVR